MKLILSSEILSFKDSVKLSAETDKKLNAINSLFLSVGGHKKKFKNIKDITPKVNKTNIWKNIIEKQKSDVDLNIKLLINSWLNKLGTENKQIILENLIKLPFHNENQTYFIFDQIVEKMLNDSNYLSCYVDLLLLIHENVILSYDIFSLLVNQLEEKFFADNTHENNLHVICILFNKNHLSKELINVIIEKFINDKQGDELYKILHYINDKNEFINNYRNDIVTNFINVDYDMRIKVLLNNMLNDGYNRNVNVQVKNINKIENLCNAILDEYLEIQNIDDVITFFEKKLQQNKDHFCKIMLKYLLTCGYVEIIKKLINSFIKLKIFNTVILQKSWTTLLEELDELLIDYPLTQTNLPLCKSFIENFSNTTNKLKK